MTGWEVCSSGTKLPIRDVRSSAANRGKPHRTWAARFGRDCPRNGHGLLLVLKPLSSLIRGYWPTASPAVVHSLPDCQKKAVDFSTAFFSSPAGRLGLVVFAQPKLAQPLIERSERLPRVPTDSTVSVTGARPEDPIARAPAGVRSITRPLT